MRFYTTQHPFYCGVDLHARTMDVCLLDQSGEVLGQRHMQPTPEAFRHAMAPSRQGLGVAVEGLFLWDWLADLWADAGGPFGLGQALSMPAIQGGQAKNDTRDAHKMAALLRGGLLPQAAISPAPMRATRDLLRRRRPLAHQRAERLAPGPPTNRQSTLPAMGQQSADQAHRAGGAERCAAPAVPKSRAVALARLTSYEAVRRDGALPIVKTARPQEATTRQRCHTVPGSGTMLSRVLPYDLPEGHRFPRGQACVS